MGVVVHAARDEAFLHNCQAPGAHGKELGRLCAWTETFTKFRVQDPVPSQDYQKDWIGIFLALNGPSQPVVSVYFFK